MSSSNWKWNIQGEKQEKSKRISKIKENICNETIEEIIKTEEINPPPAEYSRIKCLKNIDKSIITPQEELYNRLNNRAQIVQIGQNPFNKSSYIEDIEIQDRFLRGKT